LSAAGREREGSLDSDSIDNFPCEDLRTINQLWLYYSNSKFGFSVQKEIYESLGGTREYTKIVWEEFGDRVGWRKGGDWFSWSYSDRIRDYNSAPKGHLPGGYLLSAIGGVVHDILEDGIRVFSRAKACSL
jgi:hypothetical protein